MASAVAQWLGDARALVVQQVHLMALLACSLLNLLGVAILLLYIRRASVALTFPATRQSLQGSVVTPLAP